MARKGGAGEWPDCSDLPPPVRSAAMQILGIETSCDETAVAIVGDKQPRIRANLVLSQLAEHERFGGIVPEAAARAHLAHLDRLRDRALTAARMGRGELAGPPRA